MGSPAQNITRHFRGDWMGNQGRFPTPGHSASDRGMTVKDADGGDVLFYSHNGGDWKEVKSECRRLGLIPDHAANDDRRRIRDVAAWEYHGADGAVLYRKVRMALANGDKSYRIEHPDGRGGWAKGRGDANQVPYRLPDLVAAAPDATLYVAEGEKQVDKLASWGLLATSLRDWRREYDRHVAGRRVIVLPDNDQPGAEMAEKARAMIAAAGGKPVLVALPGLPLKGDIMDWRGDPAELERLVEAAVKGEGQEPSAEAFPIVDVTGWADVHPASRQWTLDRFVPQGEVTLFTGPGGVGKSLFAHQLAICHARAIPMLGVDTAGGPTLYVTAEDDESELHWRTWHMAQALSVSIPSLAGALHLVSLRGRLDNELATFDHEGRLHVAPALAMLRTTIIATGAKLAFLDNVAHLFAGNENDRGQVTRFANLLNSLCRDLGVTIVLVAHPNKSGADYSGSTAWLNAVRSQLTMKRPENSIDPDARILTLGKGNYARQGDQIAFRWHDHALILDSDLPNDQRAELSAVIEATHDNSVFLDCLAERTRQRRAVSDGSGRNYAPAVFGAMPEAGGISNERLRAAMERLFRCDAIEKAVLWRDTSKSRDVAGLRITSVNDPQPTAPTASQPRSPTDPNQSSQPPPQTHPL